MTLETRKYLNDTELMTVVKLRDEHGVVIDQLKVYNEKREVELDNDFRMTAERLDQFLLNLYQLAKIEDIEFDSQIVNV